MPRQVGSRAVNGSAAGSDSAGGSGSTGAADAAAKGMWGCGSSVGEGDKDNDNSIEPVTDT